MITTIDNIAKIITFIVAVVPIFVACYMKISGKFTKISNFVKQLLIIVNTYPAFQAKIEDIHKEIKTNGGGSIKDVMQDCKNMIVLENKRWRILTEHLNVIAWESDSNGLTTWASDAMLRVLGRTHDEVLGQNWRAIISENDKSRVLEAWDDAIARKISFYLSYSMRHKDGSNLPVISESHAIKNYKNECIGFLCIVKIRTEHC